MNTITVDFSDPSFRKLITKKAVVEFINKVLDTIKVSDVEMSVSFVDEKQMHEMNKEYRDIDAPTDILSFAIEEEVDGFNFISCKRQKRNIGDMVICPKVLSENAQRFNVTEDEELHRLLIHGTLHLNGYNHTTNDMTEPMLIKQEKILSKLYK